MKTEEILVKEAEIYTNSIVAFSVLQGLAYSYYFGTNQLFNCHVKTAHLLAESLSVLFVVVALLASFAIFRLGKIRSSLFQSHRQVVEAFTRGKIIVVLIFGLFPALIT